MFGLFKSDKPFVPLELEIRRYYEQNLLWLMQEFPEPPMETRKILLPTPDDFPMEWNKGRDSAEAALKIICPYMVIRPGSGRASFLPRPNEGDRYGDFCNLHGT